MFHLSNKVKKKSRQYNNPNIDESMVGNVKTGIEFEIIVTIKNHGKKVARLLFPAACLVSPFLLY
jgi:hypothetical protein